MTKRDEQREETRERIITAAVEAFAEFGFRGASTREIANRANANQGLITYHFRTKDELWRAAADRIFERIRARLRDRLAALETDDPRARAREGIREYVRFAAAHPELIRLMLDEGNRCDDRMKWLVDTHLQGFYQDFCRTTAPFAAGGSQAAMLPHAFYVMAGAASVMFAVAPECERLTGLDPRSERAIESHAEFVSGLLVP